MKYLLTLFCTFICVMFTACNGDAMDSLPKGTTSTPALVPYCFHAESSTPDELFSKLDEFTYPMGSKTILRDILFNQHLQSLQEKIHKTTYINWADETVQHIDAIETIDLYFRVNETNGGDCPVPVETKKLNIRIFYKPGVWDENDFILDGFEAIEEESAMFSGTAEDGKTTLFYYFWNEHYVCLLSVDTEYMNSNEEVVRAFRQYCQSMNKKTADES